VKIKSLNVLGWNVKVVYKAIDDQYCGLFYANESLIEINKNLSADKARETIIHELFHAVWRRAGIDQTGISHDTQEIICEQFSKVICENFKLSKK
jgi:Zn-dependent peptidase ImmA (M78 family)